MFTLTLVTPEKKLVAGEEIEEVFVPGYRGELNILPGHAPLLTTLQPGVLCYRLKGQVNIHAVAVSTGYAQVNPQGVNILAETAERSEEVDVERAKRALVESERRLLVEQMDQATLDTLQAKVARAQARRDVVEYSRGSASGKTH